MDILSYRKQILNDAFEQRQREIVEYQINIDNYRLAIEKVGNDSDLQDFKDHLEHLLKTSIIEQKKSQIIHDVIKSQME